MLNHSKSRKLGLMHVLIVRNNSNPGAVDASLLLSAYFSSQGVGFTMLDSESLDSPLAQDRAREALAQGVETVVALGGDGTILRAVRLVGCSEVPVLGINFGHLGFLANEATDGVVALVAQALAGEASCERRANLQVDVVLEGERDPFEVDGCFSGEDPWRNEADEDEGGCSSETLQLASAGGSEGSFERARSFFALNEAALTRGTMGRLIDVSLDVSGARIADMRGDGMVVASATGSTAYALSAGGPLVAPSFMGLIAVPLAPHTIRSRAILTGDNDVVCVELGENRSSREASLFVDGELKLFEAPIRRVYVRRGSSPTFLLRCSGKSFYEHAAETFF